MVVVNQELSRYINHARQQGVSDANIRDALLTAGWNSTEVDRALELPSLSQVPISSSSFIASGNEKTSQTAVALVSHQKTGLYVALTVVILVVVVAISVGAIYWLRGMLTQGSEAVSPGFPTLAQDVTTTEAPVPQGNPVDPKEAFLSIQREFEGVETFDDLWALTLRYGSKEKIAEFQKQKIQVDALPSEFKNNLVAMAKEGTPTVSQITNIEALIQEDAATLTISSSLPGTTGVASMVREDGVWKLTEVAWKVQLK